jgi:hypothetical protein
VRPLLPLALLLGLGAACDRPDDLDAPAAGAAAEPSVAADSIVIADSTLRFFVDYHYPRLRDAGPHTDALNNALADSARALVERFRPQGPPDPSFVYDTTVEGGFDVARLDGRVFSAVQGLYFYTGGAHGNTDSIPYNYDLTTGRPFGLAEVFRPGAAYLDTLSARTGAFAREAVVAMGGAPEDVWPEGVAPEPSNFARFTVSADTLHLYFPPYQLAAYVFGPFDFGVPLDALRPLLAADGPAAIP